MAFTILVNLFQMIREKLSAATVILLAFTGKNLRNFHVRKNAILLKCDWPRKSNWDQKFYDWLKKSSRLNLQFIKIDNKKNTFSYQTCVPRPPSGLNNFGRLLTDGLCSEVIIVIKVQVVIDRRSILGGRC